MIPLAFELHTSSSKNQRVQSTSQVQSFSFLGVIIVVVVTAVLVLISVFLEQCVALARRNSTSHRKTARQADEVLHLVRNTLGNKSDKETWQNGLLDIPYRESTYNSCHFIGIGCWPVIVVLNQ